VNSERVNRWVANVDDLLDGADDSWISADAMRWTPPVETSSVGSGKGPSVPWMYQASAQFQELARLYGVLFRDVVSYVEQVCRWFRARITR
jgi:hypothetical protein